MKNQCRKRKTEILIFLIIIIAFSIIYFCEFLIYYTVITKCKWPDLEVKSNDFQINKNANEVKAFFIADIHLLGMKKGHWFDKLRREWQMHKSFQTAIDSFQPEVVFILGQFLGDTFDGGSDCNDEEFQYYLNKLNSLFHVGKNIKIYFIAGNHDIGYHYDITHDGFKKFVTALKSPPVELVSIRGNHFVLINSMAWESDGCFLCRPAQKELIRIAKTLRCAKGFGKCSAVAKLNHYSRPILLQHFPMYRESDKYCTEPDQAPDEEKTQDFYEKWDCLSKETSEMMYNFLEPRLIINGHTHHGCHVVHRKDIHEYTVPSFNWRYKNNPSFLMGVFHPDNFSLQKCHLPQESTVFVLYFLGFFSIVILITLTIKSSKQTEHHIKLE